MKPELPISQQYFRAIRENNNLYIDKTQLIYDLCIQKNKSYFLSRPRRFGKSLTLDTIAELFQGNKSLFEGLWIADKWDWTVKHPILRFSLDAIGHKDGLTAALQTMLYDCAAHFKVKLTKTTHG